MTSRSLVPMGRIERRILYLRNHKVMLDSDLAELYGVETKRLTEAVKRNSDRFPDDFMFQLSSEEYSDLKSQDESRSWGGRRYPPYAFTEQGVAMLSSVLRSKRAVQINVEIMRTFVKLRKMMAGQEELWRKVIALEKKHNRDFKRVLDAINELMSPSTEQLISLYLLILTS